MNANTLISKIQRVIDLEGESSDAASLLEQYADAVKQTNARLGRCDAYLQENQSSEAMRIADEQPQLLDLCATLAFAQYPVWRELCRSKGWDLPPELDEDAVSRIQTLFEGNSAVESLNDLHRRAVRRHDDALRMSCLRRLVDVDKRNSVQWRQDLAVLESRAMNSLLLRIKEAKARGETSAIENVISEFSAEKWRNPIIPELREAVDCCVTEHRRFEQAEQYSEDFGILEKAFREKNFDLSLKVIKSIATLQRDGFSIPPENAAAVLEVREWLASQTEMRANKRAYNTRVAELGAAMEMDDEMLVRALLSAPEFIEKGLDEELETRARDCVRRGEQRRDRKRKQIVALVSIVLMGVAVFSGIQYKAFCFTREKNALIEILSSEFAGQDDAALGKMLKEAEVRKPALWKNPDVQVWCRKHKDLTFENEKKRSEFDRLAVDLEADAETQFKEADGDEVRGKINVAEGLLLPNDSKRDTQLRRLRVVFEQHCNQIRIGREEVAQAAFKTLQSVFDRAIGQYQELNLSVKTVNKTDLAREIDGWKKIHGGVLPTLDAEVNALHSKFVAASQSYVAYTNLFSKLQALSFDSSSESQFTASMVSAWQTLAENYPDSPYSEAFKRLALMPFSDAVAMELDCYKHTKERLIALRGLRESAYAEDASEIISEITDLEQYPSLTKLYVLCYPQNVAEDIRNPKIVFRGKFPSLKSPTQSSHLWSGEWLRPSLPLIEDSFHEREPFETKFRLEPKLFPHCIYYNDLIAFCYQNPSSGELVKKLLERCDEILVDDQLTECLRAYVMSEFLGFLSRLCNFADNTRLSAYQKELALLGEPVGGTPNKEYYFLYTDMAPVKGREQKCKQFFADNATILREFNTVDADVFAFLLQCKPQIVGSVDMLSKPDAPRIKWRYAEVPDGELYVLRQIDDRWKFQFVLKSSSKDKKLARVASHGVVEPLIPGEPIFTLSRSVGESSVGLANGVAEILKEHERSAGYKAHIPLSPAWPECLPLK